MPNYNELQKEAAQVGSNYDFIRRKYIRRLSRLTGRNVILYYSGWLQKGHLDPQGRYGFFEVNDSDKNAFMACINKLDRKRGLDLVLHTPGGSTAATESLVQYLRSMFGTDMRAIVPQLSMSAGTMIACACKEIIMGKHSSLGPIDPQIGGIPAHGIIEEFKRALKECTEDNNAIPLWQPIIAKYHPALIGECEKSIAWSTEIASAWLASGMFNGDAAGPSKASKIVEELSDHALQKSHGRHISADDAAKLGLRVSRLEDDQSLQDAVLTVHHASIMTLMKTSAVKIVENHRGVAVIHAIQPSVIAIPEGPSSSIKESESEPQPPVKPVPE